MNEKELLTHDLCGRLPYGVKGINNGRIYNLSAFNVVAPVIGRCFEWDSIPAHPQNKTTHCLPIYRPMSDLTKPITHKGETFLPIDKLGKLFTMNVVEYNLILQNLQNSEFIRTSIRAVVAEWLDEHMFNWRNLPAHLWVDVNSLENDCYA